MAARKRELFRSPLLSARLIHYSPGLYQPRHEHARAQISFLLLGDLTETIGPREVDVAFRAGGVKPAGIYHSAGFGRWGATMLSLEISEGAEPAALASAEPGQWMPASPELSSLMKAGLQSGMAGRFAEDLWWDLASTAACEPRPRKTAPRWLKQVRERINDEPELADIGAIAATVGVHRVYLSRAFRASFGLPPSLYRLRSMASRAVATAVQERTRLADVAASAGFADQSHMTRVLRAETGMSPSQLRSLLL